MLMEQSRVSGLFRCPKTGATLKRDGDKFVSEGGDVTEYKIIQGYPVLIDFESSILQRENTETLQPTIERAGYRGIAGIIKRLISPPKAVTAKNVSTVNALLNSEITEPLVLIVGGGTVGQGMDCLYDDPNVSLISFDVYASPNVQFVADAHRIPLADASFDAVIVQAVLEHVLEPGIAVSEIYRVLKANGIVYAETPFLQHVHEAAYDFTRFTESGHRYLFRDFELIQSGASAGVGTQLLWSLDYFFRGLFRSRTAGKFTKLLFFWLRYLDRLVPEPYNIDAASGVFFLGRKRGINSQEIDIIRHYKGAQ